VKIALIGYGKMGKEIEKIALERNHTIAHVFSEDVPFLNATEIDADVAIEFTAPHLAAPHMEHCLNLNLPVIVGTTGWDYSFSSIERATKTHNGSILYASNFSLGVHLFFEMTKKFSRLMEAHDYKPSITEIHHTEKLDQPSGTAITTAEYILQELKTLNEWELNDSTSKIDLDKLPIISKRIENVPGTHEVRFSSDIDELTLTHKAHNRKGFALGAVIAAEWIQNKKGLFTMSDVLNLK
jgi:4-hydroxy-tetrahydrodipicolinate reductase